MRFLAALLAFFGCALPVFAADPPRRNVLLLIADDLGRDLACYGNHKLKLPNLNALAARGTHFSHAFACVSSCSPSRASLYTGLHTHTSGQYGLAHAEHHFRTRENVQSLPALLRPAGYRSGIIGKVHVLPKSVYSFDEEITANLAGNRDVVSAAVDLDRPRAGAILEPDSAGGCPAVTAPAHGDRRRGGTGQGQQPRGWHIDRGPDQQAPGPDR